MRNRILGLAIGLLLWPANAAELTWLTDAPKAQQTAKTERKLVMLDFTGSDWCPACKLLNKEVFQTSEFAAYAKENLVLVQVDFPKLKTLPAKQTRANEALASKYSIEGFPTLVILNSAGKKVAELGYEPGGPQALISKLDELKAKDH